MNVFQIDSAESPFEHHSIYPEAVRVLIRAQMMGLWDPPSRVRLDPDLYGVVLERLQRAGIAIGVGSMDPGASAASWATAWRRLLDAVNESPYPAGEWKPARDVLGDELLAEMLDVSESSLRRYSAGTRPTPDAVAWRLHAIGRITSALAGSYNDYGIRRWFGRPREQLGGASPLELLAGDWSPDDVEAKQVTDLADALLGAGSAS
jgi:hypothetical protein